MQPSAQTCPSVVDIAQLPGGVCRMKASGGRRQEYAGLSPVLSDKLGKERRRRQLPKELLATLPPCSRRARFSTARVRDDSRWPGWDVVVGIEVHAQIKSRVKLFSDAWTPDYNLPANTSVSPFDAAFPGTLPRLNPKCVELGVRTALALNADVQRRSAFDRKHYFYADLPSGYQITQHYAPFATDGRLELERDQTYVRIKQIQLEQDTGKSTYDPRRKESAIDLSRAGAGLMEIVSEPDIRSPEEAGRYVRALQALLRAVGSSDGNMEQGSLRCDVNVSVNKRGEPAGTRCEVKNLNSVKFIMVAITSEVRRQIDLLESGGSVSQETRGFNEDAAETYSLRSKEDAPDYRYMPDPNLPPLLLDEAYISRIRTDMPELPDATIARLVEMGLLRRDADVLMDVTPAGRITHELLGQLAFRNEPFFKNPISAEQMGGLVDLVQSGKLTGWDGRKDAPSIHAGQTFQSDTIGTSERLSLLAAGDDSAALQQWCAEAIAALPQEADVVRGGNVNVLNKILGRVMKSSKGRADAKATRAMLLSYSRGVA
ncbi:GatB/GatE catalytic domain-containing protein [Fomitopsis serialis]|uniref:GatB/GatE catalytic domain-containing protein n=1 Tax=Fomitopsis serialis TaxID=139415 RepID=UPI0020080476|nr:GatB/GatE catalytic domain-containing protein [Neoantrodia serialis]KAH9938098.1 GatB/GatE catalytic domain-containing protein [Neoantrodia serialis]